MTPGLLQLLAGVLALTVVRAPFRPASTVFLFSVLVLPEALPLPYAPEWFAISRAVLWAYAGALVLRAAQEEVPASAFRVTRVHLAFGVFLAVAFLNGIVLAPQPSPRFESGLGWFTLVDQALLFVAGLAIARTLGPWWLARRIALIAVILAVFAFGERYLGFNWNHFFFRGTSSGLFAGSERLERRGDDIRARGPFLFALEFGWVCALLVPLLLVVVSRRRGLLVRLLPGFLAFGALWTSSRSALLGVAALVAITAVAARDRRVASIALLGAAAAGVIALQTTVLTQPYEDASVDSADSRVRRIVSITESVEQRPLTGLGIAGPRARGVEGVDTSYVLFYAQMGVVGLTTFLVLILTTAATVATGLRGPPSDDRALAGACLAVVLGSLLAAASFDMFSVAGSTRVLWLLAGLGVALGDHVRRRAVAAPVRADLLARLCLPAAGLAAGYAVLVLVPSHVAWTAVFDTVPPNFTVNAAQDPAFIGRVLINTTCEVLESVDVAADVQCREPREAPTLGFLRVEGDDRGETAAAVDALLERIDELRPENRVFVILDFVPGRPTWASSAPWWLAIVGGALAVLLPPRRDYGADRRASIASTRAEPATAGV